MVYITNKLFVRGDNGSTTSTGYVHMVSSSMRFQPWILFDPGYPGSRQDIESIGCFDVSCCLRRNNI